MIDNVKAFFPLGIIRRGFIRKQSVRAALGPLRNWQTATRCSFATFKDGILRKITASLIAPGNLFWSSSSSGFDQGSGLTGALAAGSGGAAVGAWRSAAGGLAGAPGAPPPRPRCGRLGGRASVWLGLRACPAALRRRLLAFLPLRPPWAAPFFSSAIGLRWLPVSL